LQLSAVRGAEKRVSVGARASTLILFSHDSLSHSHSKSSISDLKFWGIWWNEGTPNVIYSTDCAKWFWTKHPVATFSRQGSWKKSESERESEHSHSFFLKTRTHTHTV